MDREDASKDYSILKKELYVELIKDDAQFIPTRT